MAVYRVLRPLLLKDRRYDRGSITDFADVEPEAVESLLGKGLVTAVAPPPLGEIPGWTSRARSCAEAGIITVEDFLLAEPGDLARVLRRKKEQIEKWKDELRGWLTVKPGGG